MFKNVEYLLTTHKLVEMPRDNISEIVIVGKSNVGKSTLINTLVNHRKIAKTSSNPGKTKAISFFNIDNVFRLVDIPGYGYAKVSKSQLNIFSEMIEQYLSNRSNLVKAILLLDIRRGVTNDDQIMIEYFINYEIPFIIVGTKRDKTTQKQRFAFNKQIKDKLKTSVINYSAITKHGLDDIKNIFNEYYS